MIGLGDLDLGDLGLCDLADPHDLRIYQQAITHTRHRIARDRCRVSASDACTRASREAMDTLLHAIRERFLDPGVNVDVLLHQLDIDRNHIHPHFHATLGTTPWKYIQARRFDVARILLRDTHLDIWKVGTLVGYHDPRTFGRAFKNAIGRTPSAAARALKRYRERYRPADQPFP